MPTTKEQRVALAKAALKRAKKANGETSPPSQPMLQPTAVSTLSERCGRSQRMSVQLWSLLPQSAPNLPRYALVASAGLLAHEHHSAICKLVESRHFGSAAALVRPLFEASVISAWALYVATAEHVEGLHWRTQNLPKPSTMLSQLEARPELKGKLGLKEFAAGPGALLHKLTHGDMEQLMRRFGPGFNERENLATLLIADLFVCFAATVVLAASGHPSLEGFLRDHCNAVVAEILHLSGIPLAQWKGWEPLPPSAVPLGEVPVELQ